VPLAAGGRVRKELEECQRDTHLSGVYAETKGGAADRLQGTIQGPEGTPYEGGVFTIEIIIPPQCVAFVYRLLGDSTDSEQRAWQIPV
jgi:ubiquitin-protein ligase